MFVKQIDAEFQLEVTGYGKIFSNGCNLLHGRATIGARILILEYAR